MSDDHPRPKDAMKIPRADFDDLARKGKLSEAWLSSFGDGYGDPYIPPQERDVWGRLATTGQPVWAEGLSMDPS